MGQTDTEKGKGKVSAPSSNTFTDFYYNTFCSPELILRLATSRQASSHL